MRSLQQARAWPRCWLTHGRDARTGVGRGQGRGVLSAYTHMEVCGLTEWGMFSCGDTNDDGRPLQHVIITSTSVSTRARYRAVRWHHEPM